MKKIISFLAALAMLIPLTSCAEKSSKKEVGNIADKGSITETVTVSQTIYQETPVELNSDIAFISQIAPCNDGYYIFCADYENTMKAVKLNSEFKVTGTFPIAESGAVCVHDDGGFAVVSCSTDFEFQFDEDGMLTNFDEYLSSGRLNFKLTEYDESCNVVRDAEIVGIADSYDKESSNLSALLPYGGSYLLMFETGAAVIDPDGSVAELQLFPDHYGIQTAVDTDGKIIAADTFGYQYIEGDRLSIPPEFPHLESEETIRFISTGFGDFTAFLGLSGGVYGLTRVGELVLVIDYGPSLMSGSDIEGIIPCGDGEFLAFRGDTLKRYSRRPDDYTETRTRLDVWQIDGGGDNRAVTEFNKSSDEYFVSCRDCVDFTELKNALLTGDAPDIIFYDDMIYMERLINFGALADLDTFMKSGSGITREDIMPNVLTAIERQGGVYIMPKNFMIKVCFTDRDYISEEYRNWSFDDFMALCDARPEGMYIAYDLSGYGYFMSFIAANYDIWIDPMNGECRFDSPEFIKLLKFFRETNDIAPEFDSYMTDRVGALKERRSMMGCNGFVGIGMTNLCRTIAEGGLGRIDNAALLNYPGRDGRGQIVLHDCWSITETSDCKEGAWEFVSFAMSNDPMMGLFMNNSLKKDFDMQLKNRIQKGDEPNMVSMGNGLEFTDELTPEAAERYREFVEGCTCLTYHDYRIDGIISDEYSAFAADAITAEECAERIQNRVSIMLSEQS